MSKLGLFLIGVLLFTLSSVVKADECEYDFCIEVTGYMMSHAVSMGYTGPAWSSGDLLPKADEIEVGRMYQLIVKNLERIDTVGDEDVGCQNVGAVRKGEAANQIGPRLPSVSIGEAVRINYGTGESESFVIQCRHCSLPAVPIFGTCE